MRRKKKAEKPTCVGCKYLGYWNSGEPFCTKGIDKACIGNGFKFREEASKIKPQIVDRLPKEWYDPSEDGLYDDVEASK